MDHDLCIIIHNHATMSVCLDTVELDLVPVKIIKKFLMKTSQWK